MKDNEILFINSIFNDRLKNAQQKIYANTQEGQDSEFSAKILSRILTHAIKNNNVSLIFTLERQAIQRDIETYGNTDKRQTALAGLEDSEALFTRANTPEGAKQILLAMNGGKELPKKIPPSDLLRNFIKSQKSELNHMINDTSSPALKLYHGRRKEAYDHIKNEHVKNLNRGLGKEVDNEKDLGR